MKTTFTTKTIFAFLITILFGFQTSFGQHLNLNQEKPTFKYKSKPVSQNVSFIANSVDFYINGLSMEAPNYLTPISQIETLFFGGRIKPNSDTLLSYIYLDFKLIENVSENIIMFDSFSYEGPGNLCSPFYIIPDSFIPPQSLDFYTGYYHFTTNIDEPITWNNFDTIRFGFSESVFAKEDGATESIVPDDSEWEGDNEPHSWAFGNYYYVLKGSDQPENYRAESVTFTIGNVENPELVGRLIALYLYKWDEDEDEDGNMDPNERTRVGFNVYQITGDESPNDLITIPFLQFPTGDPGPIHLDSDQAYALMIEYVTNDEVNLPLAANSTFNHAYTGYLYDVLGKQRYGSMLAINGDLESETYYPNGFGDIVPVVRLNLTEMEIIDPTSELLVSKNILNLSPNPADHVLNVEIDFPENQKEATIKIFDLKGKLLKEESYKNIKYEKINFDLTKFVAGTYFLQFVSPTDIITERFVIHH